MRVKDVCSQSVVTASMDDSVVRAAQLMREHHVGSVVVVQADDDQKPAGILTDRDITVSVIAEGAKHPDKTKIRDVMSESVLLAREDDDIDQVMHNMRSNGVRRVPVIDTNDNLVGVLAFDDIVSLLSERMQTLFGLINNEIGNEVQKDQP